MCRFLLRGFFLFFFLTVFGLALNAQQVEYSIDGGETWSTYTITNSEEHNVAQGDMHHQQYGNDWYFRWEYDDIQFRVLESELQAAGRNGPFDTSIGSSPSEAIWIKVGSGGTVDDAKCPPEGD